VPVLRRGARGRDVRDLKSRLVGLGYLPTASVSDVFDDAGVHAVVAFQKYARLTPDGLVGRRTLTALDAAECPEPVLDGRGRRIEVWLRRQLVLVVENDRVVRAVAVSSGRRGYATPTGSFRVYRRERRSWSVPYAIWLPWAAYFNRGIALHAHADVPPHPASHGCVRVPAPFAREIYEFGRIGTEVVVV
jgi:peptidoglycan hydrolase-like protein with peptidoglycan-binding domain